MARQFRSWLPFVLALVPMAASPAPAHAQDAVSPGANGLVVYDDDSVGLVFVNPDGTGRRQVGLDPAILEADEPAWSPTGAYIAFRGVTHNPPSNGYDLFRVNADGSHFLDITDQDGFEVAPAWSPDGTQIAFHHQDFAFGQWDVWVMEADGSAKHNITNMASADDVNPAWSPDGSKIAFSSNRTGNWEIYLANPDGTGLVDISNNPASDGDIGALSWSPNGSRIAFNSNRGGNSEIYTMDPDGTDVTRLTTSDGPAGAPAWSPDGMKIAFHVSQTDVFSMNADGGDVSRLTSDQAPGHDPDWRPITSSNASVGVSDSGFSPRSVQVSQVKNVIQWNFTGSAVHAVTDGSGMGYFGSGDEPPGGAYAAAFPSAGTYSVLDPTTLASAIVTVPLKAKPPSGPSGTTFTITWSYAVPRPGFVFDVQIKSPGAASWVYLAHGVKLKKATVSPTDTGKYLFRARLRNTSGGHSGWSPKVSVTVT